MRKMFDLEDLARMAYRAYGETTDFKNYQGLPMPTWDDLGERIQTAWRAAAESVVSNTTPPE